MDGQKRWASRTKLVLQLHGMKAASSSTGSAQLACLKQGVCLEEDYHDHVTS
jgi:hypothetical protein